MSAKEKDQKFIAEKLTEVQTRLDQLEGMLSSGPYALGQAFTLADCALVGTSFFMNILLPMLGSKAFTDGRPKIAAWWAKVQERPTVQKVLAEQQEALMQMMAQQGR